MDVTEPPYLAGGGTVVKAEDDVNFEFPDSQSVNGGLKSLGVYVEANNNHHHHGDVKVEQNAFDGPIFWNDKGDGLLDEISPWTEWSTDAKTSTDNTDGTVYTLTVLNSNESYKKKTENLDLESFLNILPEAESDSSNYFYPEYATFGETPKELPPSPSTNNNDWKTNNNNVNDSLLRNALQGKGFQRYGTACKKVTRSCASQFVDTTLGGQYPVENGNSHIDDILGFSGVDAYGEDYEKIKKIANEVADCAKYSMPMCGNELYPLPPTETLLHPSLQANSLSPAKCLGKKFSKKVLPSSGAKSNGSVRKERSLHYCSICAKGFKDKYSVNVHVRTHTGEKPFNCNLCGKSFRQKAHLAKHYQTHLAQSQKQIGNGGGPSVNRPRPKHTIVDAHHR